MPANMMVQANTIEPKIENASPNLKPEAVSTDDNAIIKPSSTPVPSSPAPLKAISARPTSEVFSTLNTPNLESEELNKWFEDLAQYERMLEEMARANLDNSFKDELGAVENWFSALTEAERTATLFSLLHQCSNVQVRFFITVLQKITHDPVRELVSPGYSKFGLNSANPTFNKPNGVSAEENNNPANAATLGMARSHKKHGHSKSVSISGSVSATGNKPLINRGIRRPGGIDVKTGSEWAYNSSLLSIKSASFIKDPNWGKATPTAAATTPKGKNPNNLKLNMDAKQSENAWAHPKTPKSGMLSAKSLKSPFPPGLSPISWAATPQEGTFPISQYNKTPTLSQPPKKNYKEPKPSVPEEIDFEILENIPAWMRSLRLHKYTPIFESMYWKDIVILDDEALMNKGVAALGARRKFLKVFDQILVEAQVKNIEIPNAPQHNKSEETKPESTESTPSEPSQEQVKEAPTTSNSEQVSSEVKEEGSSKEN